jgi:hypothetical protein
MSGPQRQPASILSLLYLLLAGSAASSADGGSTAWCEVEPGSGDALLVRPGAGEPPITDINWFARPVPNPAGDWIIAYAMHDKNYMYNLTNGARIRIPDKSDAVATPDGRFMTVPSFYTPDGYVRFYDNAVLLEHLQRGEDADDVEPVYVHKHAALKRVFYQSLAHLGTVADDGVRTSVYRMIFSGTMDDTGFRMVDYTFKDSGGRLSVSPSNPIPLCPEIANDLMTPFISKDGNYVAAYTSPISEARYTAGASLKIYRITDVDYAAGHASCAEVVDFGFPAGKADFSFDGNALTFHISNVNYLSVFINGGVVAGSQEKGAILSTDVVVANLTRDADGVIDGVGGITRLTTAQALGVGNYFPAFLPDGKLFYISHAQPELAADRRFEFRVVDPHSHTFVGNLLADPARAQDVRRIGRLWAANCRTGDDYQYADHELPWFYYSLSAAQCEALVADQAGLPDADGARLLAACHELADR